jgi:hypothetical protein
MALNRAKKCNGLYWNALEPATSGAAQDGAVSTFGPPGC